MPLCAFPLKPLPILGIILFPDASDGIYASDLSLDLFCSFTESTFCSRNKMYIRNLIFFVSNLKIISQKPICAISRNAIFYI